jgi:hypothetical protein
MAAGKWPGCTRPIQTERAAEVARKRLEPVAGTPADEHRRLNLVAALFSTRHNESARATAGELTVVVVVVVVAVVVVVVVASVVLACEEPRRECRQLDLSWSPHIKETARPTRMRRRRRRRHSTRQRALERESLSAAPSHLAPLEFWLAFSFKLFVALGPFAAAAARRRRRRRWAALARVSEWPGRDR